MKEIFSTDIKDKKEFTRIGYRYTQVKAYDEHHIYLYRMERMEKPLPYYQYELVKGVKRKNPDGNIVYVYPTDEQFGQYGWYICGGLEKCSREISRKMADLPRGDEN